MTGITHHWNARVGYGKITGVDRRAYFVHCDDLLDVLALRVGQRVGFTPVESVRGPRALRVHLYEEPAPVQAMDED